ncbi:MAG TPA: cytochrome bc complex cytochrome b subunit [Jatrophihabitans sp.]|nr:cytochrome bc complex cytochrome b subunit [Jatrophihabitans sp.]
MLRRQSWPKGVLRRQIIQREREADVRLRVASPLREKLNKVFPDHWSFMLGEIALYSFIILLLTGTFLTFWYTPSDTDVYYHGRYALLDGVQMSDAYRSVLQISFDVRGGLLIRQIHHWAALLFVASIVVHMARIFFTGAFRKPRDVNWMIGVTMLALAIVEGFCGYSLPDDLLSGTGVRIAASIVLSIPVIGTWLQFLVWGGQYPGHEFFQRIYIAHVLLIPGILIALIGLHLTLVVRQKHTEFPAAGRSEKTVSGSRLYPQYGIKSLGLLALIGGGLAALGGLAQINPIYFYGPYEPSQVSSLSQPDWYMFFVEGALRIWPQAQLEIFHHDIPSMFWPSVFLPVAMFVIAFAYPSLERRFTGDKRRHNLLDRPRDHPVRTGLGVAALTFFVVLSIWGGDDAVTQYFHLRLEGVVWTGRLAAPLLPIAMFFITRSICLRLQQRERRRERTGDSPGVIVPVEGGGWAEVTEPAEVAHSGDPGLPADPNVPSAKPRRPMVKHR